MCVSEGGLTGALDREIVLSRVIDAPRDQVLRAWIALRQLHPSKAQRDGTIGFGAVELGYQTLDKLDEYLHGH